MCFSLTDVNTNNRTTKWIKKEIEQICHEVQVLLTERQDYKVVISNGIRSFQRSDSIMLWSWVCERLNTLLCQRDTCLPEPESIWTFKAPGDNLWTATRQTKDRSDVSLIRPRVKTGLTDRCGISEEWKRVHKQREKTALSPDASETTDPSLTSMNLRS